MTDSPIEKRTVIVEREVPHPPERVWRALTQPHLLGEWLMKGDLQLVIGHQFKFQAEWGAVDCEVRTLEPHKMLSYAWNAMGLESVVTWTLTPSGAGTLLRMQQSGFRPEQEQAYQGAIHGWSQFFERLQDLLARTT